MKDNFLTKLPIMLGMAVSGATSLIFVFYLFSGNFLKIPQKTEVYHQQPVSPVPSAVNWEASDKNLCYRSGGRWLLFVNGCDDSCERAANPDLACRQASQESCDCGEGKCWNGQMQICQPD
jgi:hypothetical protein